MPKTKSSSTNGLAARGRFTTREFMPDLLYIELYRPILFIKLVLLPVSGFTLFFLKINFHYHLSIVYYLRNELVAKCVLQFNKKILTTPLDSAIPKSSFTIDTSLTHTACQLSDIKISQNNVAMWLDLQVRCYCKFSTTDCVSDSVNVV